jgi:hypothetical protein
VVFKIFLAWVLLGLDKTRPELYSHFNVISTQGQATPYHIEVWRQKFQGCVSKLPARQLSSGSKGKVDMQG